MTVSVQRPKKSVHDIAVPSKEVEPPSSSDEILAVDYRATSFIVAVNDKGVKRYLRKETLEDLLQQLRDGVPFHIRAGIKTTKHLGPNEFNLTMNWLRAQGLALKKGRIYEIPSIEEVRKKWNQTVMDEATL